MDLPDGYEYERRASNTARPTRLRSDSACCAWWQALAAQANRVMVEVI